MISLSLSRETVYADENRPLPKFEPLQDNWDKGTLRALLHSAMQTDTGNGKKLLVDWEARKLPVPNDAELIRFAHNIVVSGDSVFGTMCLFLPNDWAAVLKQVEEQSQIDHKTLYETLNEIEIAERPPVAGEDYLRGIAYWLVVANHVFVVQHTPIQTKAFEEYFYQLLLKSGLIKEADRFALRSEFDKSSVGGDLQDITAVEIGGIMQQPTMPATLSEELKIEDVEEQKTIGRRVTRFDKAWDVLRALFGDPNAESIMKSIPSDAELEVDVRFGYKTRNRKVSRQALQDIARAARNLPDGEVIAFGKEGSRQVGEDLRLSMNMPFQLIREKGALLELDNARNQLLRVYQRFVEDDKIEV